MLHQVLHNQSILDIAIQEDGSVFAALNWSMSNGIPISEVLTAAQNITVPAMKENAFDEVANFFKNRNIIIATYSAQMEQQQLENYEFPQGEFPISL